MLDGTGWMKTLVCSHAYAGMFPFVHWGFVHRVRPKPQSDCVNKETANVWVLVAVRLC